MISESYIKDLLLSMGYIKKNHIYEKFFPSVDCYIKVDLKNRTIIYPEDRGMTISNRTTCNFSAPENFVVLECVTRLFDKGYRPEHLNLEKEWTLGHESKGGRADICVSDQEGNTLFIVECKTYGREYEKEYKNIVNDGGQLFSYWQQERSCKFLVLYASKYEGKQIKWDTESIDCSDDANIVALSQKDDSIKLFKNAHTVSELYSVWDETYEKRFSGDVIFRDDSSAYQIGVKPLRKADLKDFADNNKIVNKFEEILRHNNVSDKENAFNRLVALFICKLVDEIQKDMEEIVDFQYKVGTDTYESLQDRLQRLHKEGMEKFMKEEIFYVPDDYAENLVRQYTGQERKNMIAHLKHTLRILKFYTNNDFAFKDVHNEQLFLQNGKILVEVVQLFEKFRIIGSENLQMLGDLFEQLLSKGFKQNEGQFFTPVPITRFIWNSLPVEKILKTEEGAGLPKIIDYACGAGHFLTEGFEAVSACVKANDSLRELDRSFAENNIFGIEKDYRLARVSKISLFMHGAGEGNIIFGDGLENYPDKNIKPNTFDILVANPPYSVSAFKPHLKLKNNSFSILDTISNNGSEIETLFVERISQLLKPNAVAAVILPSSILNKENESFICARESILKNFKIRAIVLMGNKTFGATGTNTVVLFLEKYNEPPKKADLIEDSIDAVFNGCNLDGWEDKAILEQYLKKIDVSSEVYERFLSEAVDIGDIEDKYFLKYKEAFLALSKTKEKQKQKTFGKLSEKEQKKLLTKQYYQYVKKIEREKMKYFSFVYDQRTLIVAAPDDNKGQEKFLGYKWSNRKGQEVIKCARVHGVLPFLQECPVFMEEPYREKLFFYLKDYAYKDAQQAYAAETLFELFEKNGIYCMPLKGIRTKQFYPYPEFRTMGDLDILYKEDQTKKLKQVMQDAGYKFGGYNIKHDEYEKDGVTIEMHRDVLFRLTNAYDYFADIWERAIHAKGKQYIYEMSLEDHYLHSVCHLAEHFVRGGIGIRMVLDIYILSETPRMDKAYVQRQLKALKLQKFEENIRSLAQLWFSDDEKTVRTEVSDELENYALSGGIFGSRETARRNGTVLYESKNKFVKQLVFPSYEVMKTSCPWLKTPILLPAAWLVRYKRALTASRGNIGYHIERAKTFDRVEDQEQKERCQFFERCGLEDVSENF